MFKELIAMVPGNQIFAIAGMLFFLLIFGGIVIWTIKSDRSYLEYMRHLPLEKMKYNGESDDDQ